MGKATSSGLKHRLSTKDSSTHLMAPQKWSSETLIPNQTIGINSNNDEKLQDVQKTELDKILQSIIDASVVQDSDIKEALNYKNNSYMDCDKLSDEIPKDSVSLTDIELPTRKDFSYVIICAAVILDHSYALSSYHQLQQHSYDYEDDISCNNSPQSEEIGQHCHNVSHLQIGVDETSTDSTLNINKIHNSLCGNQSSSAPSVKSDFNSSSQLGNDQNSDVNAGINSPQSPYDHVSTCFGKSGKIDAKPESSSFSFNSSLLEKLESNKEYTTKHKQHSSDSLDHHFNSFSMCSPSASPNFHPLLQSPTADWDRSEADSETHDNSSDTKSPHRMSPYFSDTPIDWPHSVFHDHDYYAKNTESVIFTNNYKKCKKGKRKYNIKGKLDRISRQKIMKSKYLKKELLRNDRFIKCDSSRESAQVDNTALKTTTVRRPKKRSHDKIIDEIDPQTGTKLKITGKFKDEYVYYLSKSSRTTSRARHTLTPSATSDKIFVPAPNPGDIIIPHLTDADIEALRIKGCTSHNPKPHETRASSNTLSSRSFIPFTSESDVDSHIVSTILSMENDSIASAEIQEIPQMINATDFNPNQPALTESLRMISGDPNITSEQVLNYLLCMVKDEALLSSERAFDNGNSALFSSPSTDNNKIENTPGIENKVCDNISLLDHSLNQVQNALETKSIDVSSIVNQTLLNKEHVEEVDRFDDNKYFVDDNAHLPDDLSSFLSESKGSVSPDVSGYSDNLMKSTFETDLNLLSQRPIHRLTSIEKTLDYLGVKDEDVKFDNFVFNSKVNSVTESHQELTSTPSTFVDATPWIVTITLYFNDVPAIMMNNQPHIRLVDIHKQILPAKDTGILKKRCQLLKIPVLCCTEMQRYFLVQYGRAYNSKSTLIISKDNANDLVTYYATPQPRMARTIETQHNSSGGNKMPLDMKLPGFQMPSETIKHGIKESRKTSHLLSLPASKHQLESHMSQQHKDKTQGTKIVTVSHDNRTRHKKINYLDLLKGEDKDKSSNAALSDPLVKPSSCYIPADKPFKLVVKNIAKVPSPNNSGGSAPSTKHLPLRQKRIRELDAGAIQNVKFNIAKNKTKLNEKVEREVNVCSESDSDGCVNLLQSKKCRPIKLKMNSLLNIIRQQNISSNRKHKQMSSSNTTRSDTLSRVLSVVHQSANNSQSMLPSQAADIHLDLFVKPNSSCVRCATCSQFLSVPHFMRHHHVPLDSDCLTTEAAHRILVPRNKENISQQERQLWAEFHRLQESIGGFGEADDETDNDDNEDLCSLDSSTCHNSQQNYSKSSDISISSPCEDNNRSISSVVMQAESGFHCRNQNFFMDFKKDSFSLYKKLSPTSEQTSNSCHKRSNDEHTNAASVQHKVENSSLSEVEQQTFANSSTSNTRTSTRVRKSKQLFSIENYYTPKRWAINEELISHKHVRT